MKPIPGLNKALQHKTRQLAGEAFVRIRDEAEAQYRRMLSSFYSAGLPESPPELSCDASYARQSLLRLQAPSPAGDPLSAEAAFDRWLRAFCSSAGSRSARDILSRTCKQSNHQ